MRSNEADVDEKPFQKKPSVIWRLITGIFKLAMVLLVLLLLGLGYFYYTSQQLPEFYAAAMKQEPAEAKALGTQLETNALDIYNSARSSTSWQGELSEDEINGWLASELPVKFPDLLPENIKEPRVMLKDDDLSIACRCSYQDLQGVLVGSFDLFCTDVPNQIAIRIKSIKMGFAPFPVTQFADQITETLKNSGFESSWTELDGDPVLLIDVHEKHLVIDEYYLIEVKSFEIEDKKILFSGETVVLDPDGETPAEHDESLPE